MSMPNQNPGQFNGQNGNGQGNPNQNGQYGYNPQQGPQGPQGQQGQNQQGGPQFYQQQYFQQNGQTYQTPGNFNPRTDDAAFFGWSPLSQLRTVIGKLRTTMIWGGVVLFLLGLLLLVWPGKSMMAITAIIGVISVVLGIGSLVTAFTAHGAPTGWRVLDGISGVFFILAAAVMFRNLASSAEWMVLFVSIFLGISWIVQGFMQLFESASFLSTGWSIFTAVLSIIAGFIVLFSPISSMFWIMIVTAIMMMIQGFSFFIRGLNIPKQDKQ